MGQHNSPSSITSLGERGKSSHDSKRLTASSGLVAQQGTSHSTADQASSAAADDSTQFASPPPSAQPPATSAIDDHFGRAASIKATAAFQGAPPPQLDGLMLPSRRPSHQVLLPPVHTGRTCNNGTVALPARVQSVPASMKRSDWYLNRQQSSLSAGGVDVEAASLSRPASLANMLLRMSSNLGRCSSEHEICRDTTSSFDGRTNNVSMIKLDGNTLAPLDRCTTLGAKAAPLCCEDSQGGISQNATSSTAEQQAAEQTDSATRFKRSYSLAAESASPPNSPLADIWHDDSGDVTS